MAIFKPGTTITTREDTITVDAGLPVGKYRFQLVVEGEKGGLSEPVESIVEVTGGRILTDERVLTRSELVSPLPDRTATATTTTTAPAPEPITAPAVAPRPAPAVTPIATPLAPLRPAPATTPLASPTIRPGIRLPLR